VIPFHKCSAVVTVDDAFQAIEFRSPQIQAFKYNPINPAPASITMTGTESELIIRGPGKVELMAWYSLNNVKSVPGNQASAILRLTPVGIGPSISIECSFKKASAYVFDLEEAAISTL